MFVVQPTVAVHRYNLPFFLVVEGPTKGFKLTKSNSVRVRQGHGHEGGEVPLVQVVINWIRNLFLLVKLILFDNF